MDLLLLRFIAVKGFQPLLNADSSIHGINWLVKD
jgi:hypothetical protein